MAIATIYGERCSGTTYLEQLLLLNFDVNITWKFTWKHFFGFSDLNNSDDVYFIGIVRNLHDWLNSLYRHKYHLPNSLTKDKYSFLNNTFYSINDEGNDIVLDYNIYTNKKYKNIFEMRYIKNKFLIETMPTLVKHYILITYDELVDNFQETMEKLKIFGLPSKYLIYKNIPNKSPNNDPQI